MPGYNSDTAKTIDTLSKEILAGIIAAPRWHAEKLLATLEPGDFPNWIDCTIFEGLRRINFAGHPAPGSVITQLNTNLLNAGKYADHDNGLRAAVLNLATTAGHPEQVYAFANELIEWRFRNAVAAWGAGIDAMAFNMPLKDLEAQLANIDELRRLHARIKPQQELKPVQEVA